MITAANPPLGYSIGLHCDGHSTDTTGLRWILKRISLRAWQNTYSALNCTAHNVDSFAISFCFELVQNARKKTSNRKMLALWARGGHSYIRSAIHQHIWHLQHINTTWTINWVEEAVDCRKTSCTVGFHPTLNDNTLQPAAVLDRHRHVPAKDNATVRRLTNRLHAQRNVGRWHGVIWLINWCLMARHHSKVNLCPLRGKKPAQSAIDGQRDTMHSTIRCMHNYM